MTPQIGDTAPDFEPGTTEVALGTRAHNDRTPKHLFEVIARTTACSSMVCSGLLAWASLNAQIRGRFLSS
jgi:hypothetical protein